MLRPWSHPPPPTFPKRVGSQSLALVVDIEEELAATMVAGPEPEPLDGREAKRKARRKSMRS